MSQSRMTLMEKKEDWLHLRAHPKDLLKAHLRDLLKALLRDHPRDHLKVHPRSHLKALAKVQPIPQM